MINDVSGLDMEKYHHKIDKLRKEGRVKEAIDLARFASAQLPSHRLIKQSYAWAVYSYLKEKGEEVQGQDRSQLVKVEQLCREYRRAKLGVGELCYSLILRRLCMIKPVPLGLFHLVSWSRSQGFRSEDYLPESGYRDPIPLIDLIAMCLAELVTDLERGDDLQENIQAIAHLSYQVQVHLLERRRETKNEQVLTWRAGWLARRAGLFDQALDLLYSLVSADPLPEVLWEIAQCIAREASSPSQLRVIHTSEPTVSVGSDRLHLARAVALAAAHHAREKNMSEEKLAYVYARSAYWSSQCEEIDRARALMGWAIELKKQKRQVSPYAWTALLNQWGGESDHLWETLRDLNDESLRTCQQWFLQRSD